MMPEVQESRDTSLASPVNNAASLFSVLLQIWQLERNAGDSKVDIWQVGDNLGINERLIDIYVQELLDLDLLRYTTPDGGVALTPYGASELALVQSRPDTESTHFPSLKAMSPQLLLTPELAALAGCASLDQLVQQLNDCSQTLGFEEPASLPDVPQCEQLDALLGELSMLLAEVEQVPCEMMAELEALKADLAAA